MSLNEDCNKASLETETKSEICNERKEEEKKKTINVSCCI